MSMSDWILTTRQVADFLGVSPETVLRRVRVGELPAFRIATNALRFDADEVPNPRRTRRRLP